MHVEMISCRYPSLVFFSRKRFRMSVCLCASVFHQSRCEVIAAARAATIAVRLELNGHGAVPTICTLLSREKL